MYIHNTAALLTLLAVSALATPVQRSDDDQHQQQLAVHGQQGQLPFIVPETHNELAIHKPSSLPSLESFQSLLLPLEYAQLADHVASLPERRIIALSEQANDRYTITEGEKALLVFHNIKFIDITDAVLSGLDNDASPSVDIAETDVGDAAFPSNWTYGRHELQKHYYDNIDTSRMKAFLKAFSSFRTRYYRSNDGRQSQLFLLEKIKQIVSDKKNKKLHMTVEEFPHPWGQNSIIVKLPANDTENAKGTIVVGAHQDSTNLLPFLSAP